MLKNYSHLIRPYAKNDYGSRIQKSLIIKVQWTWFSNLSVQKKTKKKKKKKKQTRQIDLPLKSIDQSTNPKMHFFFKGKLQLFSLSLYINVLFILNIFTNVSENKS